MVTLLYFSDPRGPTEGGRSHARSGTRPCTPVPAQTAHGRARAEETPCSLQRHTHGLPTRGSAGTTSGLVAGRASKQRGQGCGRGGPGAGKTGHPRAVRTQGAAPRHNPGQRRRQRKLCGNRRQTMRSRKKCMSLRGDGTNARSSRRRRCCSHRCCALAGRSVASQERPRKKQAEHAAQ